MGCVPVEDSSTDIIPSLGSIKTLCECCQRDVWLGLKQQELRGHSHVVCYPCLIAMGMTPDSLIRGRLSGNIEDLGGPTATIKPKHVDN